MPSTTRRPSRALPPAKTCPPTGEATMSQTPTFDRFPYPRRLVVGLLRDEQGVQRASELLRNGGFESDRFTVLHGADDARSLDVTGEAHGLRGEVIRALQAVSSDDLDHVQR